MGTETTEWPDVSVVYEEPWDEVPAVTHAAWSRAFPWLLQGTTTRGSEAGDGQFDLRLFGGAVEAVGARERWGLFRRRLGTRSVVHAKQVHGATVRRHRQTGPGLILPPDCDGHVTKVPGVVLAVSVADCVPVSLVEPEEREVGLLHAGWRGTAAGVLERGIRAFPEERRGGLYVHMGPSICGACYEVGGEVFEALGLPVPPGPEPVDLRLVLARRAVTAGIDAGKISVSGHCTRCGDGRFFSHRGGDTGRQVAFLGIRQ